MAGLTELGHDIIAALIVKLFDPPFEEDESMEFPEPMLLAPIRKVRCR